MCYVQISVSYVVFGNNVNFTQIILPLTLIYPIELQEITLMITLVFKFCVRRKEYAHYLQEMKRAYVLNS